MNVGTFREILFWPLSLQGGTTDDIERSLDEDGRWKEWPHPFAGTASAIAGHEGDQQRLATQYAAAVYMHPFVQKLLYPHRPHGDAGRPVLRRFRATGDHLPKRIRVTLSGTTQTEISFRVDRLELSLFRTGVVILQADLWCETPNLSLAVAQQCLDEVRRCYVPFWKGNAPGQVPASVAVDHATRTQTWTAPTHRPDLDMHNSPAGLAPTLLPWWAALLAPLSLTPAADGAYLSHVVDDRLPGMAFLTLDDPTALGAADWVRLCFADPPGSGLPHARSFLPDFAGAHCYDRFWDPTGADWMRSRYLLAGYQFTFVGREEGFTVDVLQDHFRHHYADMALVLQYQQAALLRLMERLTPSGDGRLSDPEFRQRLRNAQDEWLDFLGHGWFPTLSNQVQGQELFEKWRDQMRLPTLYREVSEKARDMTALLNAAEGHEATQAGLRLNMIATLGIIAALIAGLLGINLFLPGQAGDLLSTETPVTAAHGAALMLVISIGTFLSGSACLYITRIKPAGNGDKASDMRFLTAVAINCLAIACLTFAVGGTLAYFVTH
ncbi:hypothetical protein [Niveispirillum sp.]|uniref:hypothetical protein n=1 Tax=Niveispirillum sp. TaxID=1917217 RepID=UPI001B3DD65A|nr:hypothetical protein [Niveispirillum sp.]MBP7339271.1 hypothetical protein [Niveispirillum sp.]